MKRKTEIILSLSAVALLVVAILVIVIRRRGRKVYLKESYRLNNNYYISIHPEDNWDDYIWYNGTLDYVVIPYKARTIESDTNTYIEVKAVGELGSDGKIRRLKLDKGQFIDQHYLNL